MEKEYDILDPSGPTDPNNLKDYDWGNAESFSGKGRLRDKSFKIKPLIRKTKEWVKPDNIIKNAKHLSSYTNAKTRDFLQQVKQAKVKMPEYTNLAYQEAKKLATREGRDALISNINVTQHTQNTKKLMEGNAVGRKALQISQHKWFRKSAIGIGVVLGLSLFQKAINGFDPKPTIPKNYDRGYDVMSETLTDFGSPVKLLKTASKIITPYYSSVRKGIVTTTNSVTESNVALFLNKKAIGHTRY